MTTIRSRSAAAGVHNKYLDIDHAMVCRLVWLPYRWQPVMPLRKGSRPPAHTKSREEAFPSQSRNGNFEIICCDREQTIRTFAAATPDPIQRMDGLSFGPRNG